MVHFMDEVKKKKGPETPKPWGTSLRDGNALRTNTKKVPFKPTKPVDPFSRSRTQLSKMEKRQLNKNRQKIDEEMDREETSPDFYEPIAQSNKKRRSSSKKRSRSKPKKPTITKEDLFEQQIDLLPEFKGSFLATSGMNKNFSKSTKAIVDAQVDPTLFESNCYH